MEGYERKVQILHFAWAQTPQIQRQRPNHWTVRYFKNVNGMKLAERLTVLNTRILVTVSPTPSPKNVKYHTLKS
jgi:hypothetical protein